MLLLNARYVRQKVKTRNSSYLWESVFFTSCLLVFQVLSNTMRSNFNQYLDGDLEYALIAVPILLSFFLLRKVIVGLFFQK